MKNKFFILSIAVLISAEYAKSQTCVTAVNNSGTTGTQYYVPRYSQTGAPCLQNSSIWDNGNVGINSTSTYGYKLYVNGTTSLVGNTDAGDINAGYITALGFYGHSGQGCAYTSASNAIYGNDWSGVVSGGGTYDAFMGAYAGGWNSSGSNNTLMGAYSGYYNATGGSNTIAGYYAGLGVVNNNYSNNSFFGYEAGFATTTGGNNVFMGYEAGVANTSASNNVFVGYEAGLANVTGTKNSFFGNYAGYSHTGNYCAFFGYGSGFTNSSGADNTYLGYAAGYSNSTGAANTFVGTNSGYSSTTSTGGYNTFIGLNAGYANTTGGHNTALGNYAGDGYTTGTYDTYIGYSADANANSYTDATALGYNASVTASYKVRLGDGNVTVIEGAPQFYTQSDGRFKTNVQENVKGLQFIKMLRPVTYNLDTKGYNDFVHKNDVANSDSTSLGQTNNEDFSTSSAIVHSGFIAQEVYQAELKTGYVTDIVHTPADDNDNYSVAYGAIVVPLVQAVQELSSTVDSLQAEIAILQTPNSNQPSVTNNQNLPSQPVTLTTEKAILYQNNPNPTNDQTSIGYYLAEGTVNAEMVFFDVYGKEIKRVVLENRGNAKLDVNTKDLESGIYSYSLIVDGKVIDTLKMVKTK